MKTTMKRHITALLCAALVMTGLEAGEYPLYRPFIMVTHNGLSRQSPLVRTWFAYVYGSEGRELLRKAGIVPGKLE